MNSILDKTISLIEPGHKYVLEKNPSIEFRSVTEIVGDYLITNSKILIPSLPKSIFSKEIKISFISHACLIIETEDFSFATDPWIIGFAFASGWWLTNKPVKDWEEKLNSVDFIYISHNHPDHLNIFTLSKIRHDMTFVIPPFKSKSVDKLLIKFGFKIDKYKELGISEA